MDALLGLFLSIYFTLVIGSLAASCIYIWKAVPYWNSMEERELRQQLTIASRTASHLERALKIAEEELAPLKQRDEEITIERYKRGERDFYWQS